MKVSELGVEIKKPCPRGFPGLHKDEPLGFAMGCGLGAIGAWIYLRSWFDGLLCAAVGIGAWMLLDSLVPVMYIPILCGGWVVFRIRQSNKRYESARKHMHRAQAAASA